MSYILKTREEFNEYLKDVQVLPSSDEMLLDDFNSSSLFDLYSLLTKIKNDRQISYNRQKKFKNLVRTNFSEEIYSLLSFPITNKILQSIEEYIKNIFLSYVKDSKSSDISEEEMENLKIIVAKKYPSEFLNLIKNKKDPTEFKLEREFIKKTVSDITDEYWEHSKNMQTNEDTQTSYYTTSNNDFPKAQIATTGRLKSFKSMTDNLRKEFINSLEYVIPSDVEKGISYSDLTNNFNLSKVSDDYYGFLVYVTDINDTFHLDEDTLETEEGKEFRKYRKQREENISLFHSWYNFLHDSSSFLDFTEEEYLQIKIELLDKLQSLTYVECSEEYEGPLFQPKDENDNGTSFSKLLQTTLKSYRTHLKANNFKHDLSDDEHSIYQDELLSLFKEFENRINDKIEFTGLKIMVPKILKDKNFMHENILRDQLDVKVISVEPKFKRNGFMAIFSILQLPDGRKIEVQFLPYGRYKSSKDGNFAHSRLANKQLDISCFFELKDEFKNGKNYESTFKNAIHILDNTTIAERNRLLFTPIEALTSEQKKHRKNLEFALKSLQIKEHYTNEQIIIRKNKDGSYKTQKEVLLSYSIDEYLPIFAQYHSPRTIAVSSPHSRVNKNTAFVNIKTLLDNFREVLLKEDETTCLADILLKRLQQIQEQNPYITLPQNNIRHLFKSNGIPDDKIEQLIQEMASQAQNIRLPYTNSVSDIKERTEEKNAGR